MTAALHNRDGLSILLHLPQHHYRSTGRDYSAHHSVCICGHPVLADGRWSEHASGLPSVASVSQALRELYLNQPFPTTAEDRATAPIRCSIGEALYFDDLQTIASFFREVPRQNATYLLRIRCIIVSYLDDQAVGWWPGTNDFAYEAFELLYQHWHLMSVSWLRLHLPCTHAVSSVDNPGIWSLYRCIAPNVRAYLKARTRNKKLFPWRPLGVENPGPHNWQDRVKSRGGTPNWRAQYDWLEARYKYLHDRRTVVARCAKQRSGYLKQRKWWPMLSKGRKRRRL